MPVPGEVTVVTDQTFDAEVLRSEIPVLVEFWARWCSACQLMFPALDTVAREYGDRLAVTKLDVDQSPVTAEQYDIGSMPTLMLFRHGRVVHTVIGAKTRSTLIAELGPFL